MGTDELFEKLYLMYFRLGGVFLSVTGLEALYADLGKRAAFSS